MGADAAVHPAHDPAGAVAELTGRRGAELVLDVVGSDETLALAAGLGRPEGDLTVLGLAGGVFSFDFFALPYECSLQTTYWGSGVELTEVLELARRGAIRVRTRRFPLERVEEAYRLLREGELAGRAVVCPHGI